MNFQLRSLWVAIGFLTRIPVGDPSRGGTKPVRMAAAVPWFPIVGLGIGAIQSLVFWALYDAANPAVAAAMSTAVSALVTGAFHHDGLADMADAFGGGWTVEQRMEILQDSRLGTYGTTALISAFLLEFAALSSLPVEDGVLAVIAMHVMGRGFAVAAMLFAPIAGDGLGASYMQDLRPFTGVVSVAFAVAIGVTALGPAAWSLAPAAVVTAAVVILARRKIGGVTGDVLGAIAVLSGLTVLACVTI